MLKFERWNPGKVLICNEYRAFALAENKPVLDYAHMAHVAVFVARCAIEKAMNNA